MSLREIFIIESNSAGNGVSAIQYAKKLGYKTCFITGIPEKYENMKVNPMQIADEVIKIDTTDIIKLLHFTEDRNPLAIVTFDDFHIVQASIMAQSKGLPHPNIDSLLRVRFKDKTRRSIQGIGKEVAYKVFPVHKAGEISPIGIPCVVKPVDESGSVGVRVCFSNEEYREATNSLQQLKTNITGYRYMQQVLVEEYIEGDEYSAEMIWDHDLEEWRLIGFTKKLTSGVPYFIEIGHTFPYSFGNKDKAILDTIRSWLKAVGLTHCAAHVEFKICKGKPALMEINPRVAGGFINELVQLVKDRDLVSAYLDMCLGRSFAENSLGSDKFAAIRFILPPRTGVIQTISPPDEEFAGMVRYDLNEGERKVESVTNGDDRIGHVIMVASTADQALNKATKFTDRVKFDFRG